MFSYLAIYNNENLPNWVLNVAKYKITHKKLIKFVNILTKFDKSGQTDPVHIFPQLSSHHIYLSSVSFLSALIAFLWNESLQEIGSICSSQFRPKRSMTIQKMTLLALETFQVWRD